MPFKKFIFFLLSLFVSASFQIPVLLHAEESSFLYMGAGQREIRLPPGIPLSGYGKRRGDPSTGTHDPIFARALALKRGREQCVFVSVDLALIDANLRLSVLRKIQRRCPIRTGQLILTATHTHSGPGAIGDRFWERFIMGKFREPVFQGVATAIAEAAAEALQGENRVEAEYGKTSIQEFVQNRMDEKLDLPHELKVLKFRRPEGQTLGFLVFMAAHPTILPASNRQLSADFPGVLTKILEKENPGAAALFINGAAGDLRPKTGEFFNRFERMEAYGVTLAKKIKALEMHPVSLEGPWRTKIVRVKLPRVRVRAGRFKVPSLIGNQFFPRRTSFQAVRLGRLLFLVFPGELGSEIGRDLERRAEAKLFIPFLVGYGNDYLGYVMPERYYLDRTQYESQASFYGRKMDSFVQKKYEALTDSLLTDEEKSIIHQPGEISRRNGLPLLKVTGDPYHVGFEEGRLLGTQIKEGTDQVFRYLRSELPIPILNRLIFNIMLRRAWKKMEPYVSYDEYLQMKGIADGSRVPFRVIRRIHALPELYPTWCSNGAYWGPATSNGRLVAIRNLDWNRKMRIHDFAAVKFLKVPGRKNYVNIGYAGFSGVLSGINEKGISVGQIGATSADETMEGVPMPFLLKRVLEDSESVEDAARLFKQSTLTRGYNYVIADALHKQALAIETTRHHWALFRDDDPKEREAYYSIPISSAVLRSDTAIDPAIRNLQWASKGDPKKEGLEAPAGSAYEIRYRKHADLIKQYYGRIDSDTAREMAREIAPGSNIQSVVYAFPEFWVANAEGEKRAADSKYTRFNFEEF